MHTDMHTLISIAWMSNIGKYSLKDTTILILIYLYIIMNKSYINNISLKIQHNKLYKNTAQKALQECVILV